MSTYDSQDVQNTFIPLHLKGNARKTCPNRWKMLLGRKGQYCSSDTVAGIKLAQMIEKLTPKID